MVAASEACGAPGAVVLMQHGRYPRCFGLTGTYIYVTIEGKKEGGEP